MDISTTNHTLSSAVVKLRKWNLFWPKVLIEAPVDISIDSKAAVVKYFKFGKMVFLYSKTL